MAATTEPAGDHSPCHGVATASAVNSDIPESLAERPDCLASNIQDTFDRDEQPDISDLNDETGKSVPHVITMRDTTQLVGSFMVPPTAQLHRPKRWILLILVIGVVTAIAYYLDRHSGPLTGGVMADQDRTFHAMKGDETSTPPRPIQPAKTTVPIGPPSESPSGGSIIVPAEDTAGDMAAGLGKGPLRPAGRADGVGESTTPPRERVAEDRSDVSAAPDVSPLRIELGQTTAQASMKRSGAKNTGDSKVRGTRRTLEDKGIPTPPVPERTRPQKTCSYQERILGFCN